MDERSYTRSSQINKIVWNDEFNCLVSGHEDKFISFYDLRSNTLINRFVAHADAVTDLTFGPTNHQLTSVSHDGSIRIWDIRKFNCLYELTVNLFSPQSTQS